MSIKYQVNDFFTYKIKWVKWWYQRASRGYADCDVWSLDSYLNSFLPKALRQLKRDAIGHPATVQGLKTWLNLLEKMALGFESSHRLEDAGNWTMNEGSEIYSTPCPDRLGYSEVKFTNEWTPEQVKHFKELDKKDRETFKNGMNLFAKYYMSLWD